SMTGTPCCLALLITAAALGESRLTISRALTPSLSIWSAIVPNLVLSPLAFWMSASTPAALNDCASSGRSAPSQRAEEAVSGRITPTLAFLVVVGVDVQDDALPVDESSLPHAATPAASAPAINTTVASRVPLLVIVSPQRTTEPVPLGSDEPDRR